MTEDIGFSGNYNKVINAGETIKLKIKLINKGADDYISTSGFLESKDTFVVIENQEAVYDEIMPGQEKSCKQVFILSISPECPNNHIIWFNFKIWDTYKGIKYEKFGIPIKKVGPLVFADYNVDDDIPGPSNPVIQDGRIQSGEQIEFKVSLLNKGEIDIKDVTSNLLCEENFIDITEDRISYPLIPAQSKRETNADYDFYVGDIPNDTLKNKYIILTLIITGKADGHSYIWFSPFTLETGLTGNQEMLLLEIEEINKSIKLKENILNELKNKKDKLKKIPLRIFKTDNNFLSKTTAKVKKINKLNIFKKNLNLTTIDGKEYNANLSFNYYREYEFYLTLVEHLLGTNYTIHLEIILEFNGKKKIFDMASCVFKNIELYPFKIKRVWHEENIEILRLDTLKKIEEIKKSIKSIEKNIKGLKNRKQVLNNN